MKTKYWDTCKIPGSYSDLLNIVEILEKAVGGGNSKSTVAITVDGVTNTTVNLPADRLADIVLVMKTAFQDED